MEAIWAITRYLSNLDSLPVSLQSDCNHSTAGQTFVIPVQNQDLDC
jgi:hypothetical protein